MRYCPVCQRKYEDDTFWFCLEDGTRLVEFSDSQLPTVSLGEEQTLVSVKPTERASYFPPPSENDQSSQVKQITPPVQYENQAGSPEMQKSNTMRTVVLTVSAMIALFGTGIGAWYFLSGKKAEIAENKQVLPSNSENKNVVKTPSPKPSENIKTATPKPTPQFDAEAIKAEVSETVYTWKDATESGDIDDLMSNYAESVNFYGEQMNQGALRNAKQNAFQKYDAMSVIISNLRVTPDESGEKATAVFDKEWFFSGEKIYEGKVQTQFQLTKSNGRWLITSEKDLKIYYVNK